MGSAERFRALVPLINDDTQKIVVLSAMAGTTNALVEMSELFSAGNLNEARRKCEALRKHYHSVKGELFASVTWSEKAGDLIEGHFDYIAGLFSRSTAGTMRNGYSPAASFSLPLCCTFFFLKPVLNQYSFPLSILCVSTRTGSLTTFISGRT